MLSVPRHVPLGPRVRRGEQRHCERRRPPRQFLQNEIGTQHSTTHYLLRTIHYALRTARIRTRTRTRTRTLRNLTY